MWLSLILLVLEIIAKLPQIEEAIKALIDLIKKRPKAEHLMEAKRLRKNVRGFLLGKKAAHDTLVAVQEHLAELSARA
jgi:hypothetical protein